MADEPNRPTISEWGKGFMWATFCWLFSIAVTLVLIKLAMA